MPRFKIGLRGGLLSDDILTGSDRRDVLHGFLGHDELFGGGSADMLFGGRGDDELFGGAGRDFLFGGKGNDRLSGGEGPDKIFGGKGEDVAVYEGAIADYELMSLHRKGNGPIKAKVADSDGAVDRLHGVEGLYFAADDYTAWLDGRNNAVLARDDAAESDATGTLIADVTANDFDFDGDALTVVSIDTTGLIGSAVLNDDGTIAYSTDGQFAALAEGETAETTLTYTVTDGNGSFATATVTITVTGENDAPELDVATAVTIDENTSAVTTALASDVDNGAVLTFSLSGDDAALFAIDAAGNLSFVDAPDFEDPRDADGDNVYDVTVTVTDEFGAAASEDVAVTVADVDETPPVVARINEFHYDNAGSDVGEFIEIRVEAGGDASGLSVVLYNGNDSAAYNTLALPATPSSSDGTWDYYVIELPSNGIQNGSPDGIALANGTTLIEFLSYEGSFVAAGGVADGVTSTDIGVSEPGDTAVGLSLQREEDGTWTGPRAETKGAENLMPAANLVITEIMQNPAAVSDSAGEYFEIFNAGPFDVDINGWTVSDNDVDSFVIDNGGPLVIPAGGYLVLGNNADSATNGGVPVDYQYSGFFLSNGADEIVLTDTEGREIDRVEYDGGPAFPDPNGASMELIDVTADNNVGSNWQTALDPFGDGDLGSPGAPNGTPPVTVAINEFHYDNLDTDVGEFVEVAGTVGADLTGWTVVLYNGNGGAAYATLALSGTLTDDGTGTGFASVAAPGMQNGSPDGLALVAPDGSVVEFLSYEGVMVATDGPAAGLTSTDVGSEPGDTPEGFSLQKQADGSWLVLEGTRDATNAEPGDPTGPLLISQVQGNGSATAFAGQVVSVEAVVTAVLSNGFYLQEEDSDADGDAATSEGIFVFTGDTPDVSIGDVTYVTGTASEFFNFTQISADTLSVIGTAALPTAAVISLPVTYDLEAFEGMRVNLVTEAGDAPLTIIENFNFDRFGEIVVSEGTQIQPTQIYDAQTEQAEIQALAAANQLNRITIDDGNGAQNPTSFAYIANTSAGDDGDGILSAGDTFTADGPTVRLGAEITGGIEGVLSFNFGEYKIIPTETLAIDPATNEGAREATPPDVGGELVVASFNALNYFTTLRQNDPNARGASTPEDFVRQTDKLVNALIAMDADVVGLQELENNGFGEGSAIDTLVDALNAALGSEVYGYVDPNGGLPIGTDAITTGIIYKLDSVTLLASDFLVFSDGDQQRNRPATAAAFEDADGEVVTIVSNHFKSKGSSGLTAGDATNPDSDQGDGQGFWNETRTDAAEELAAWLATDPLGVGDPDVLILGDLNAYSQEDPVQALEAAGYDNLLELFIGAEDAFSFVFDGQQGSLDHALSSAALTSQITGVVEWHINAQEPDLLGYNSAFTDPGFYNGDDVFASSDHDPLLIGITLDSGGLT